jgi:hypothetical protein
VSLSLSFSDLCVFYILRAVSVLSLNTERYRSSTAVLSEVLSCHGKQFFLGLKGI